MEKETIRIHADPETTRRIELAAALNNVAMADYCLTAIRRQLAEDDLLEQHRPEIPVRPKADEKFIRNLQTLREKINARRGGQPIDVDRIMSEMRDEREHEILGLR